MLYFAVKHFVRRRVISCAGSKTGNEDTDMKKIIEIAAAALGRVAAAPKEIQYRYVFVPPAGGEGLGAVCVE